MHPYITHPEERRNVTVVLVALSIVLAFLLDRVLSALQIRTPWWLDTPSPFAFYGLLYTAFDRWAWRWPILCRLSLVNTPDFGGCWKGYVTSSWQAPALEKPIAVLIKQNWSQVSATLETVTSRSSSLGAFIVCDDPTGPILEYTYRNEPKQPALPTMHAHRGTAWFQLKEGGSLLEGEYYTGRDRQTQGAMVLRRETRR